MIKRLRLISSSFRPFQSNNVKVPIAYLRTSKKGGNKLTTVNEPPPPAANSPENCWEEVRVPEGVYYWNTMTDETTAIGAPKPTGATALYNQQPPQQSPSFMGMVAEGFSFGVGASIARNVVGSIMGSESDSGSDDDTDQV
jgi:hypothetical protein